MRVVLVFRSLDVFWSEKISCCRVVNQIITTAEGAITSFIHTSLAPPPHIVTSISQFSSHLPSLLGCSYLWRSFEPIPNDELFCSYQGSCD